MREMKLKDIKEHSVYQKLKEPDFAAEYLGAVLTDGSFGAFLIALRDVAEANGGVAKLAKLSGLGRESMYKTLSNKGNPQLNTIISVLKALGLELSIRPRTSKVA